MSRKKLERQLNLAICLMASSRFLTIDEIADAVPGYDRGSTPEDEAAFRRMFERDKSELRELGVPIETGNNSGWDDDSGYRIPRRDYALPELHFTPDELAALGLAARFWSSATLAEATATALRKLRAAGVEPQPPVGLEPRMGAGEPHLDVCLAALRERRPVRFGYRRRGQATTSPPEQREVEPWGVLSWRGRWYLAGFDRGRGAERVFRLSRIVGDVAPTGPADSVVVPPDVDVRAMVESAVAGEAASSPAVVWLRPGTGWRLRRGAQPGPAPDTVVVTDVPLEALADEVAGLGPDAVALEPAELVAAVRQRLNGALAAHQPSSSGAVSAGVGA